MKDIYANDTDYNQIHFDEKLESVYNADELKDLIGRFVKVKDSKECFLFHLCESS